MARLNVDAAPMPQRSAIEIFKIESGNCILVAPFPSGPTKLPMKSWSTML